jgi:endonuclease/exonuclease/phosphatase family metal-dependent hydrolase
MSTLLDKGIKHYENLIVIGDLNYDLLCTEKSQTLDDLCDIFDLTNIIKSQDSFKRQILSKSLTYALTSKFLKLL